MVPPIRGKGDPVKQKLTSNRRRTQSSKGRNRWTRLAYDDVAGIDDDIERLIGHVQKQLGCTRDRANAELVRKLSFAS